MNKDQLASVVAAEVGLSQSDAKKAVEAVFDGVTNGTYVNAKGIQSEELVDGDVLQVGRFKLVFFHGIAQN